MANTIGDLLELRADAERERQTIQVLKDSISQWSTGREELRGSAGIMLAEEDNEWKTRYESQSEFNELLRNQHAAMRETIPQMKKKIKVLSGGGQLEEFQGVDVKKLTLRLNREKNSLQSQLRDYEWRLDQEARLFHKADEKRKAMLMDINRSKKKKLHEKSKKDSVSVSKALKKINEKDFRNLPYLQRRRASLVQGENVPPARRVTGPIGPTRNRTAVRQKHFLPKLS